MRRSDSPERTFYAEADGYVECRPQAGKSGKFLGKRMHLRKINSEMWMRKYKRWIEDPIRRKLKSSEHAVEMQHTWYFPATLYRR